MVHRKSAEATETGAQANPTRTDWPVFSISIAILVAVSAPLMVWPEQSGRTGALVVVVGILIFLNEFTSLNQYFNLFEELNSV